jgi:hypothetical protein
VFFPKRRRRWAAEFAVGEADAAVRGRIDTLRRPLGFTSVSEILPRPIQRFRKFHPDVRLQMRDMSLRHYWQLFSMVGWLRVPSLSPASVLVKPAVAVFLTK